MKLRKFGLFEFLKEKFSTKAKHTSEEYTLIPKEFYPHIMKLASTHFKPVIIDFERDKRLMDDWKIRQAIEKRKHIIHVLQREIECQSELF